MILMNLVLVWCYCMTLPTMSQQHHLLSNDTTSDQSTAIINQPIYLRRGNLRTIHDINPYTQTQTISVQNSLYDADSEDDDSENDQEDDDLKRESFPINFRRITDNNNNNNNHNNNNHNNNNNNNHNTHNSNTDNNHNNNNNWNGTLYERPAGPISPNEIAQRQYDSIKAWLEQQETNGRTNTMEYISWKTLIEDHIADNTSRDRKYGPCRPFRNEGELGLFIMYYSMKFQMSESQVQAVIELLLILRQCGVIASDYYIPKHAKTVGRLRRYFPVAPLS